MGHAGFCTAHSWGQSQGLPYGMILQLPVLWEPPQELPSVFHRMATGQYLPTTGTMKRQVKPKLGAAEQ